MRSREDIWGEFEKHPRMELFLETLLDIRELLQKAPGKISGVAEEELDATLDVLPPEKDEKFDDAVALVRAEGRVSSSLLIECLGVTYTKAAQLIDQLETFGIIGPAETGKSRKVL